MSKRFELHYYIQQYTHHNKKRAKNVITAKPLGIIIKIGQNGLNVGSTKQIYLIKNFRLDTRTLNFHEALF